MARHTTSTTSLILLVCLAFVLLCGRASSYRGKVGGRKEVENVGSNKQVQELGRFCVQEYNRQLKEKGNGSTSAGKLLAFSQVVKAETQVVSGVKYYLKISAAGDGGGPVKTYDAVVWVKPWARVKQLLSFAPATPHKSMELK